MKYILASSSPRREKMLSMFDIEIEYIKHLFDEKSISLEKCPREYSKNISRGKGKSISNNYKNFTIISADTIVLLDNEILEKPRNKADAINMLKLLSGREHVVITGVCLICESKSINFSFHEETIVKFKKLDIDEIEYYVDRYNPLDKSGSYGIQDFSSIFVKSIDGCFFNVVGLPLFSVFYHLKRLKLLHFSLNSNNRINKL